MEASPNIEYYKILYGMFKKFTSYNGKWKNFESYITIYFRCLKKLKYEIGLMKIDIDSELKDLKLEELHSSSNNLDKKVTTTIEIFLKQESCTPDIRNQILSIIQKAKKNSEDYITNYSQEQFDKYGFQTLLNNKSNS